MAKKKIKQTSTYWRDWKRDELQQAWSETVVKACVSNSSVLHRLAHVYKTKLNFIDFGLPARSTRHTRPPLILFNKTLTKRYIVYTEQGFIFAQPKITILK